MEKTEGTGFLGEGDLPMLLTSSYWLKWDDDEWVNPFLSLKLFINEPSFADFFEVSLWSMGGQEVSLYKSFKEYAEAHEFALRFIKNSGGLYV
jgi:hypothetical protein